MAEHHATITWQTAVPPADVLRGRYSREHTWTFDGGAVVPGSSSPHVVPKPWSVASAVDPEEALVAAISSCHMLTFVYLASKAGFAVSSYRDAAVGTMAKNAHGTPWVAKVTLHPEIVWGDRQPTADELADLHHRAHEECYIAQSVKTEIVVA